ncbi:phosphotransferase enzyme family protein [Acidocella sp. KAb 2-4]|uniref:phosphotransferase enzyme family protein n=1 Tax=Acidocella sp. KAb 2-4 TaxID=2885158 RepID=UPI001D08C181|nr:phosphotransferase enzyme family protein [Acidocella sp. KAb 2-4]MCB5944067.1 phosphotransferase enzyme family protein [Acidocella sp. KAb 2-4]
MMHDFDTLSHDGQMAILMELAQSVTRSYDLPAGVDVKLLNLSENATYRVQAPDGQRWALRVHRGGYHTKEAIASELAWLRDLRAQNVVVTPTPIAGKNGELIQTVHHPRMIEPRHVVLSHWEAGVEPGIGDDLTQPFEVLGEITARMHQHSRQWRRPSWFVRPTWNFETTLGERNPHWGKWRDGMGVDAQKAALFGRTVDVIGKRLLAYGQDESRFGLIHCDLRLANLLIDDDIVKVIDFDDCGFGWFMYDAATPLSFYEHEPQVSGLIEAWKTGYRRVAKLPAADEREIPTFVMLRRILLLAWIGSHAETETAQSMGVPYTEGTVGLCEDYLAKYG